MGKAIYLSYPFILTLHFYVKSILYVIGLLFLIFERHLTWFLHSFLNRIYFRFIGGLGVQVKVGSKGQVRVQLPSSGEWAAGSLLYLISEMSMMVR